MTTPTPFLWAVWWGNLPQKQIIILLEEVNADPEVFQNRTWQGLSLWVRKSFKRLKRTLPASRWEKITGGIHP